MTLVVFSGSACEPGQTSSNGIRGALSASPLGVAAEPGLGDTLDGAREWALKASYSALPEALPLSISPPSAEDWPRLEAAELGSADVARLDRLPMAVLLPDWPNFLDAAVASSGETWYAVSGTFSPHGETDVHLVVFASAQAFRVRGLEQTITPQLDSSPTVTTNEGGLTLTFRTGGVAYALTVECLDPHADAHCSNPSFLMGAYDSLAWLAPPEEVSP